MSRIGYDGFKTAVNTTTTTNDDDDTFVIVDPDSIVYFVHLKGEKSTDLDLGNI